MKGRNTHKAPGKAIARPDSATRHSTSSATKGKATRSDKECQRRRLQRTRLARASAFKARWTVPVVANALCGRSQDKAKRPSIRAKLNPTPLMTHKGAEAGDHIVIATPSKGNARDSDEGNEWINTRRLHPRMAEQLVAICVCIAMGRAKHPCPIALDDGWHTPSACG